MLQPSIAARLDGLPVTRTHVIAAAIVGIGAFFDLFDVFLAGVLSMVLTERFGLSQLLLPAVLGSSFLGMFFGAISLSLVADRYGRRTAYLFNLALYSAFTLLGAVSVNAIMLIITRFIAGLGIGAELPLVDAYLSELVPARRRGLLLAWAYTGGFIGVPAVGFLARLLVPAAPLGVDGWRWLFVAGSAGSAIIWVLRRRLPESPRWLAQHGRHEEADAIVSRMEQEALATRGSLARAADRGDKEVEGAGGDDYRSSLRRLFSPPYSGRAAMLCVFQVCQTAGYYGFGTIVPLMLAAKGFPVVTSLTYTAVTYVGYPIGSMLSIPLVERLDRRWLIVAAAAGMAVLGVAFGSARSPGAILTLGFAYTVVSNVLSNAFHVFQAEIFPTSIRATAAGSTYSLSRLSAAAQPFILLPLLRRSGPNGMFAVIVAAMIVVIVTIAWGAPSTTGRTLEEISVDGETSLT